MSDKSATHNYEAAAATPGSSVSQSSEVIDLASPGSDDVLDLSHNPGHHDPVLSSHAQQQINACPFGSSDWDACGVPPRCCLHRAKRDLKTLMIEPLPCIFFTVNEKNLLFVHSMIVGNFDTPYEGGFFQYMVRFGPKYPFDPPRVCCMSSYRYGSDVRFHPNMYANGTVCLSLLGTWSGPAWSATNNLSSVLLSIQSLFTAEALCNEPGYDKLRNKGSREVKQFDMFARHETLRVAVVETVRHARDYNIPDDLYNVIRNIFFDYMDSYIRSCDELSKFDGTTFQIVLVGQFVPNFKKIKKDLMSLSTELQAVK
ncbi:Ubiquitin-conjugating enzyme E2 [Trinorchestia longiramus]|nr:Ubiquitin-conjugating enzyme E2 [Trinorchestia longiramus]